MGIVHLYEVSGIAGTILLEVHALGRKVYALIDQLSVDSISREPLRARASTVGTYSRSRARNHSAADVLV